MRTTPWRAGAVGTALCLCLAATACTNAADWQPSGKASSSTQGYDTSTIAVQPEIAAMLPPGALSDGVLDVAASTDYAPAEFLDTGGRPVGYDVDLTRAIAAVLGVRGEVHTAEFDSIMASIGNKYDAGISSFTVTREREAAMDMIAYVNVGSQFTVQAGNPQEVDPSDHLHLCGLSVGVQVGTSQETAMQADSQACAAAGREPISVRSYSKQSEATTALTGGTIDAVYSDSTVAGYAVEQTGGQVEIVGALEDALPQAIVMSKADPRLTAAVQAAMQYLMDSGIWTRILETWGIHDAALTTAALNPDVED